MGGITYIKVFVDYLDAIEPLSDDERGRLFTALLEYAKTGDAPPLDGNERFLFPMMRAQIDRDASAMAELSETRSRARKSNQMRQVQQMSSSVTNVIKCPQDKDKDKDKDKDDISLRTRRFTPPTLAEVQSYVAERHSPVDPQSFIDFYEAKGWMVGKTPMKDWKAACRNAEKWDRWDKAPQKGSKPTTCCAAEDAWGYV